MASSSFWGYKLTEKEGIKRSACTDGLNRMKVTSFIYSLPLKRESHTSLVVTEVFRSHAGSPAVPPRAKVVGRNQN